MQKQLSRKEKMALEKRKKILRELGEEVSSDDDSQSSPKSANFKSRNL